MVTNNLNISHFLFVAKDYLLIIYVAQIGAIARSQGQYYEGDTNIQNIILLRTLFSFVC